MVNVPRVLVLGGGIGGLSAAIALRKVGYDAHVYEQSPELREAGAGVGLWSNAMGSLDQLGAAEEVRRHSRPMRIVGGANARGETLSLVNLDSLGDEFAAAACFVIARPVLLAALAACLPAEAIHTGWRGESVEPLEDAVRVHFAGGQAREAELVVAADGLHSVVRPYVAGEGPIRYSGQTCFRGISRLGAKDADALREVHGRGQRAAVCPLEGETAYWWTAYNAPRGTVLPVGERKAYLLERYRGWPSGLEEHIAATDDDAILQNDLVDRAPASPYARGRMVLLGDAAHPTTPNLGQGANMAIDDAISLARALRAEASLSAALRRYEAERLRRTHDIVDRSWAFGRMCLWESSLAVWVRDALIRSTPKAVLREALRSQVLESVGLLSE
jgi:2-polyprenyl-6-methoxyphenol hydroxylase-like FAD-dependent oxidoreductase